MVLEMSDCVRLLCGTGEDWGQTQVLGFQTKVLLIVPEYSFVYMCLMMQFFQHIYVKV